MPRQEARKGIRSRGTWNWRREEGIDGRDGAKEVRCRGGRRKMEGEAKRKAGREKESQEEEQERIVKKEDERGGKGADGRGRGRTEEAREWWIIQ